MNNFRNVIALVVAVTIWSGCGIRDYHPGPIAPTSVNQDSALIGLRERASFEMECPIEELDFKVFSKLRTDGSYPYFGTVGVLGCDRRAVYLGSQGEWVLNSLENQLVDTKREGSDRKGLEAEEELSPGDPKTRPTETACYEWQSDYEECLERESSE